MLHTFCIFLQFFFLFTLLASFSYTCFLASCLCLPFALYASFSCCLFTLQHWWGWAWECFVTACLHTCLLCLVPLCTVWCYSTAAFLSSQIYMPLQPPALASVLFASRMPVFPSNQNNVSVLASFAFSFSAVLPYMHTCISVASPRAFCKTLLGYHASAMPQLLSDKRPRCL